MDPTPSSITDPATVPAAEPVVSCTEGGVGTSAEVLRDRLLRSAGLLHRARVELLDALVDFDRAGVWVLDGARTCAQWVSDHLEVHVGTARDWLRIAHALAGLPTIAARFRAGAISYSAVREVTRIAVDHPDAQQELVDLLDRVAVGDVGAVLAAWCDRNEDPDTSERRRRDDTRLSIRVEPDGMATLTLHAPALDIGRVHAAIDARVMHGHLIPSGDRSSIARQRALALIDLLTNTTGAKVDTEVIVHVRSDGCTLHDGTPLAEHTVAALIDTAFIRALIHDIDGHPIDATERHRHPNTRQRRVVDERHPTCVDCGTRDLLEYDHDPAWALTHRTLTDELTRRCAPCHRTRHRADGGS